MLQPFFSDKSLKNKQEKSQDPDLEKKGKNSMRKQYKNFPSHAHRTPSSVLGGMHPYWPMAKPVCIAPFDIGRVRWSQGEFFKPRGSEK